MRRWAARAASACSCSRRSQLARAERAARHRRRAAASSPPTASTPSASRRATVDRAAPLAPRPRRRPARLAARRRRGLASPTRRRAVGAPRRAGPSCCRVGPLHRGQAPRPARRAPSPAPARRCASGRASLVLARRPPGRVGGRAPRTTRSGATGARDVFLAGWHEHDDAARRSSPRADAVVLASVREQFGSVLVEGDGLRPARRSRSTASARPRSSPTGQTGLARGARRRGRARRRAGAGDRPARASAGAAARPRAATSTRALRLARARRAPRPASSPRWSRRPPTTRVARQIVEVAQLIRYPACGRERPRPTPRRIARLFRPTGRG